MKVISLLTSLVVSTLVSAIAYDQTIPNRYIIEFHEKDEGIHKRFLEQDLPINLRHKFEHEVFTGMSFDVRDDALTFEEIKKLPQVKNVWPVSRLSKRENSYFIQNKPAWNPHRETGVQELHKRNITGEGIVIGLIDSGVDVNHPALKGKILSAVSFINSTTPTNGTIDRVGHGTSCGSIIVGDTPQAVGVAPGAKLRAYQVDSSDSRNNEAIILAFLEALKDKVDMISISMGEDAPYPDSPVAQIAAKAAERIPVITSASNEGDDGPYSANDIGSAGDVIAVGMSYTEQMVTYNATLISSSGNTLTFAYVESVARAPKWNATYMVQVEDNICNITLAKRNVSDTVVIGSKGKCQPGELYNAFTQVGYKGAIVLQKPTMLNYLGVESPINSTFQLLGSASFDISAWILKEKSTNSTLKLTVNTNQLPGAIHRQSSISNAIGKMSSWGPTHSQGFFPHIIAPGGNYFIANPQKMYYENSGTSLSCPYVAGVVALYLSTHKNATVKEVKNRLLAATSLLPQSIQVNPEYDSNLEATFDSSDIAPLIQQGTGFIDAVQFFDKKTVLLSEPYFSMNDTSNRVSTFNISFKNGDSKEVTYNISNKGFQTVYTRNSSWSISKYYPRVIPQGPTAKFILNTTITLRPGEVASFNVTIQPPKDIDEYFAPVFDGAIYIEGSNNETVRVPYIGSQFKSYDWLPFDEKSFVYFKDGKYEVSLEKIKNTVSIPSLGISSLGVYFDLRIGSTYCAFSLVNHDYQMSEFSPSTFQNSLPFNGTLLIEQEDEPGIMPAIFRYLPAKAHKGFLRGVVGSANVPPGHYRILACALRPFGNSSLADDYQLKLSRDFRITESTTANSTTSQASSGASPKKLGGATNSSVNSWLFALLCFSFIFTELM